MSTTLMPAEPTTAVPTSAATDFAGELRSEWTKIRSVRSTIWALVALIVVTIGFTALFNWLTVSLDFAIISDDFPAAMSACHAA